MRSEHVNDIKTENENLFASIRITLDARCLLFIIIICVIASANRFWFCRIKSIKIHENIYKQVKFNSWLYTFEPKTPFNNRIRRIHWQCHACTHFIILKVLPNIKYEILLTHVGALIACDISHRFCFLFFIACQMLTFAVALLRRWKSVNSNRLCWLRASFITIIFHRKNVPNDKWNSTETRVSGVMSLSYISAETLSIACWVLGVELSKWILHRDNFSCTGTN